MVPEWLGDDRLKKLKNGHSSGGTVRAGGVRTPGHSSQNQLSMAHRGSQKMKGFTKTKKNHWILYGSELGPLHIHYGCVSCHSCETSNSGSKCCLILLSAFGILFLLLGCLVQASYEAMRLVFL